MRMAATKLYWLMLLVPALLVAWFGYQLISHEQDRLETAAKNVIRGEAELAATAIHLAVADAQAQVLAGLQAQGHSAPALQEWSEHQPLVRNVFIWERQGPVLYPDANAPLTVEESAFLNRYQSLFDGEIPLEKPGVEQVDASTSSSPLADVMTRSRKRLAPEAGIKSGWLPWFDDNQLYLLGWIQPAGSTQVYGAEIEMMALLSTLAPLFASRPEQAYTLALEDGNGVRIFQSGPAQDDAKEILAMPVGADLPHWRITCLASGSLPGGAGRGWLLLYLVLLALLVAGVLAGGTLLYVTAQRSHRDALQKTTFVSNVSHELKTPLTSIRMYAELLEEGRAPDEEKRRRYLSIIGEESRRLTRLVNNVLDFSRLEQGRKRYSSETLCLQEVIQSILDQQTLRCREAGLALTHDWPDHDVMVQADRDALSQALLNLVDNAIKYGGSGGQVELALREQPGQVAVDVLDHGPGIPAAQREKIFEKFYRIDDSLTTTTPGSGLGLTIARQLARDLGGDVICLPREGGGTCFRLILRRPS